MQRRFQGQADARLDEVGRAQARAAARQLAAVRPRAIVSSDLSRAVQTAAELAAITGLPVTVDARLREGSLGYWEGLTREEVRARYPQEYADWVSGHPGRRGGGELRSEVAARAVAGLAELPADVPADVPDDLSGGRSSDLATLPVVLVTHSATAMALTGYLLGLPESHWRAVAPLANCHWSELRRDVGGWQLRSHNVGVVTPRTPPVPEKVVEAERVTPDPADAEALDGPGSSSAAPTP
jgi:Fructose-2,6-bisphosphatase